MNNVLRNYTVCFLILLFNYSYSQDTIISNKITESKSPKKAAILSSLLPGAGQVYNHSSEKGRRRLWKVPVIYAGIATAGYFLHDNITNYKSLKKEYVWRLADPNNLALNYTNYSIDNLRTAIEQFKSWRDLSVVSIAGIYILQIVDASVDAHLFNHDISTNLTLRIMPRFGLNTAKHLGISLTLLRR